MRESIKIARKMMEVDGPATLLVTTGRRNSLHRGMVTLRAFPAAEEVCLGAEVIFVQEVQEILTSFACYGPGKAICFWCEELGG